MSAGKNINDIDNPSSAADGETDLTQAMKETGEGFKIISMKMKSTPFNHSLIL